MDAVAAGTIFLVPSGGFMGYQLKPKRRLGLRALSIRAIGRGFFGFGLAWLSGDRGCVVSHTDRAEERFAASLRWGARLTSVTS
jgi:hypothetical protein